jgi:peroxiredoxin
MVSGVGAPAINHNLNRHADLLCVSPALSPRTGSDEFGLSLGRRAPSFVLKDQNERDISLASLVEKGTAVLVFYRSADWCPFCKQQLVDLQRNLKEIEASGGQLVGISYDSVAILKRFASRRIGFPLLSDSGSRTIDAYNIRDQSTRDGVSRHATFVIDRKGIVRAKLFQVSYAERPAVDDLIKAIKEAQ